MAIEFTVDHDHTYAGQEGIEQLIGWVTFSVSTYPGDFRVREQGSGVARTLNIPSRRGWLATDGHMYKDQTLEQPCRLVGNDPSFNLKHLTYRADFDLTTIPGDPVAIPLTYFPAPSTDTTLQLTKVIAESSQPVMEVRTKGYIEDILDVGSAGAEIVKGDTVDDLVSYLNIPGLIKDSRIHIDLRDWDDVRAAQWDTFLGGVFTASSTTVTGTPLTSADVGKVFIMKTSEVASEWFMTTVDAVASNGTVTLGDASPVSSSSLRVRYGFDGSDAINAALQDIDSSIGGPTEVFLQGSYRATQLVIPAYTVLHGVGARNSESYGTLGKTILAQLPGSECDFVVFEGEANGLDDLNLFYNGLSDLYIRGPEKVVTNVATATTGHGVALGGPDREPGVPCDGFRLERVRSVNFPESGFRTYAAVPLYVNQCEASFNGRFGWEHRRYGGSAVSVMHLHNFSGDWNNLGLVGFRDLHPYDTVAITGLKSEGNVSSDEADEVRGAPGYQSTGVVFEDCDSASVVINDMSHIRVARAEIAPGPAITIKSATDKRPNIAFNAVTCRLKGDETGSTTDAVTIKDEVAGTTVPQSVHFGFYPYMPAPKEIRGDLGNKILKLSDSESASAWARLYNGETPAIAAEGSGSNVAFAVWPKGSSAFQIWVDGTNTPRILPVGSETNIGLNLQSKNAGVVQINGAAALYSGGALGTPASGTLTNCTSLPVDGIGTGSTSKALGVGSIEIGHATDTTLTRSAAGRLAVEGVQLVDAIDFSADPIATGQSTFPRRWISAATLGSSNGFIRLTFFTAGKSETFSKFAVGCGTASVGSSLQRIGLYTVDLAGDLTLVAATTSDTGLWAVANTVYEKALGTGGGLPSSYALVRGTRYAVGIIVVGTSTAPTFMGTNPAGAAEIFATSPRLSGYVTMKSDLDTSITNASLTNTSAQYYVTFVP